MLHLPVLRWGKPYESLDVAEVAHFHSGEPIAKVSQANGGIIQRDYRKAHEARQALRSHSCADLIAMCEQAASLYESATLPIGDGTQTPDEFIHAQSASTGLPEHMCRSNMKKSAFVLANMNQILDALTRGLPLDILSNGYGTEDRGVIVSYQAQTPVLGAVLPSNSPGVHTLWLPAIPLQVGLMLKPGSSEPWTPYRIASALIQAGVPSSAIGLYPGGHDAGPAVMSACARSMVFGGQDTINRFRGDPRVQAHGPGYSKIIIGDDRVDDWEDFLDVMVESVISNGGRSCINCSSIWASRHTQRIAAAIAERIGPTEVLPPDDPNAALAAFTTPGVAQAVASMIEADLQEPGVSDLTKPFGERLIEQPRCAYLKPIVAHCDSPDRSIAAKEFMFPFVSVVECPQDQMIRRIGPTLVASAITDDEPWIEQLGDCVEIDRLNIGPIPTQQLNWLQPHEGNIIDFLFRSRAYQRTTMPT